MAESKIVNNGWTEFKLETPVKVVKGEKYWLTNTTFQKAYGTGSEEFHKYQLFYHERASTTEDQPWGNYTNEPHNWEHVARTLKELPSPETTKINCEKCNTEGWLQEEPKGFDLLNTNRGAQEEGGQTYSYAYGTIEEGAGEEVPTVLTGAAAEITQTGATLNGSVNPNGSEVTECEFEYGTGTGYGSSAPCTTAPGSGGRSGAGDGEPSRGSPRAPPTTGGSRRATSTGRASATTPPSRPKSPLPSPDSRRGRAPPSAEPPCRSRGRVSAPSRKSGSAGSRRASKSSRRR